MKTYEIPSENLAKLELRISALARKAVKLSLPEPDLQIIGSKYVPVLGRDGLNTGFERKVFVVTVTGESPRIEGWTLIAIIEHGPERNVITKVLSHRDDADIPNYYRTIDPVCQHCKLDRSRKHTFLICNETELMTIGSDCLKDFTGHKSPDALATWYKHLESTLEEAAEEDFGGGAADNWISLPDYLTRVAAVIEQLGWTSRGSAENTNLSATADIALDPEFEIETLDQHSEIAEAAIAWVRTDLADKDNLNDYEWNLVTIFTSDDDYFDLKHAGYVASAINAFNKIETEKVLAESSPSEYQGEIKERLTDLRLTVVKRLEYEGYMPDDVLHITIMEDEDHNVYVWKTSAKKLSEGETYLITGTVKAHNEYKEIKQTILTRCKVSCPECGGKDTIHWDYSEWAGGQINVCWPCYDKEIEKIKANQEAK